MLWEFVRNEISRLMMKRDRGGRQTFLCRKMLPAMFPQKGWATKNWYLKWKSMNILFKPDVVHIKFMSFFDIFEKFYFRFCWLFRKLLIWNLFGSWFLGNRWNEWLLNYSGSIFGLRFDMLKFLKTFMGNFWYKNQPAKKNVALYSYSIEFCSM